MMEQSQKYLYLITFHRIYESLCSMEMKSLFGKTTSQLHHFTNDEIQLSRSTFLRSKITILYREKSIDAIESKMISDKLQYDDYKIHYIKMDPVSYKDRLLYMRKLGYTIEGDFSIKDAKVNFALVKIAGEWVFGTLESNSHDWLNRKKKPFSYSNAIEVRLAMSVLNIAIQNDFNLTIVDPCSGIGTILIEALIMKLNIKGFEISPFVKINANKNLVHFGFNPISVKMDMLQIEEQFDVAILDLPYGLYSSITRLQQKNMIQKTKEISNRLLLISMEDMTEELLEAGYEVKDACVIEKSNAFKRYITLAE